MFINAISKTFKCALNRDMFFRQCACQFLKRRPLISKLPDVRFCSKKTASIPPVLVDEHEDTALFGPAEPSELADLGRNLSPTYNFAAYVNQSETLQNLVKLGVELYKYEKNPEEAKLILNLNFEKDVKPYIHFLCDNGVLPEDIGKIFSKNIILCKESLEDLQIRINYMESKKFTKNMIANIITRNPYWLTTPIPVIDRHLGYFQKNFKLTGDEVRNVINALPQIATFNINSIKLVKFVLEEEMGMTKPMIKKMLLNRPRIFIKNQKKLLAAFEYIYNEMNVPTERICQQPNILMMRKQDIMERHLFLKSLGRAQYNPVLPGYISLDSIPCDVQTFVTVVAKSTIKTFDAFLRTL